MGQPPLFSPDFPVFLLLLAMQKSITPPSNRPYIIPKVLLGH